MQITRRFFLKGASSVILAGGLQRISFVSAAASGEKIRVLAGGPLRQFGYGEIQFDKDCLQQKQFEHTMTVLQNQSEDSLLKPFRLRSGLPAPGNELGGWYDEDPSYSLEGGNEHGFAPGHSFGQWVSSFCRAYAITGDVKYKEKAERLIRLYAKTISMKFWQDFRWPTYTFDKLNLALVDAHKYIGFDDAFVLLRRTLDVAYPAFPECALDHDEMRARPHKDETFCWDESYTLPENLFLAYQAGAGGRYKDLAIRYLKDDTYFNPLSEGKNVLPEHHAYSYTNALSSAMQAYLTVGSQKHLYAAANAFRMIRETQSFATGGWGPDEQFRKPDSLDMFNSLSDTHNSFETPCGSYAHFKIARYLMRVTGDSLYGDSMEQVMYNTILGALPLEEDGRAFYYSDYNFDGKKFFRNKWTCCSGTLPQIACDYRISTYLQDDDGIFVNLYINSNVVWKKNKKSAAVKLRQKSSYPLDENIEITISTLEPAEFLLRLRIPDWTDGKAVVKLNGKAVPEKELLSPASATGFACIKRQWQNGDKIELELPMTFRLQAIDKYHQDVVALMRGPLVLFGINALKHQVTREQLLEARRSKSDEWIVSTRDGEMVLRPFTSIKEENYSTYIKLG